MTRLLTLAALALVLLASPATAGGCVMSYCQEGASTRSYVRNNWNNGRQIIGDFYRPSGHNRRIQIRNNSRQVLGFIEPSGRITNRSRQEVRTIDELMR